MATTIIALDPETISMDELRKLAEAEALAQSTTPVLTTATVVPEKETPIAEVAPKTFFSERTIDLGDGAGVQVFKGKGESREAALEDLSDKLADAQKHATKKIRDLSKAKPVEKTYTKDEESLYSAELIATPTTAFKKLFKDVTGVDVEEFKTVTAREKEFQAGQTRKAIGDRFVAAHPEFLDSARNAQRLNKAVTLQGDFSLENLEKAYQDLNESGLLEVKGEEASAEQKAAEAEAQRIAATATETSSLRTRRASGLSTQRRTAVPVAAASSEEDMYALPLEELRKLANKQLSGH